MVDFGPSSVSSQVTPILVLHIVGHAVLHKSFKVQHILCLHLQHMFSTSSE